MVLRAGLSRVALGAPPVVMLVGHRNAAPPPHHHPTNHHLPPFRSVAASTSEVPVTVQGANNSLTLVCSLGKATQTQLAKYFGPFKFQMAE